MASRAPARGVGFALLPEIPRFVIAVAAIVFLPYSTGWISGIGLLFVSVVLLALNLQIQRPTILSLLVLTTFGWLVIGNWFFSPSNCDGIHWFLFSINHCGLEMGLESAYTRTAQLIVGWAWFEATGINSAERALIKMLAIPLGKRNSERYIASAFALAARSYNDFRLSTINAELLFPINLWMGIRGRLARKFLVRKTVLQSYLRRVFDWSGELLLVNDGQLLSERRTLIDSPGASLTISKMSVWRDDDNDDSPLLINFSLCVQPGGITILNLPESEGSLVIKALSGEIPYVLGRVSGQISYGTETLLTPDNDPLGTVQNRAKYFYLVQSSPSKNFSCVTVRDHMHRRAKDDVVADQYSERFSINALMDRNPFSLSGGQQMRVAIAAALASDAPILLLDSPYSELDTEGRDELDKCLSELAAQTSKIVILNGARKTSTVPTTARLNRCIPERRHNGRPVLGIQEGSVVINGLEVLKNISISICAGDFVLLTGPNGSGKSTLLRLLAGHEKLKRGRRYCEGVVGFVFQDIGMQIVEDSPVLQVTYGRRMNPRCKTPLNQTDRPIQNLLATDTSSLPDYSKRALIMRSAEMADVILLDEPTKEMDHMQSLRLRRRLAALCKLGKSVVVATHDPEYFAGLGRHYGMGGGVLISHRVEH